MLERHLLALELVAQLLLTLGESLQLTVQQRTLGGILALLQRSGKCSRLCNRVGDVMLDFSEAAQSRSGGGNSSSDGRGSSGDNECGCTGTESVFVRCNDAF